MPTAETGRNCYLRKEDEICSNRVICIANSYTCDPVNLFYLGRDELHVSVGVVLVAFLREFPIPILFRRTMIVFHAVTLILK